MKKKTKDYLKFINMELSQDDEMFCVNSDTALLGYFMDFPKGKSVLDIGTNNGALLMYASRFSPSCLVGIDVFEKAIALAKENLSHHGLKGEFYLKKVQEFVHDPFDVIVCNPPFFENNNPRQNPYMKMAMFEENLSLEELFSSCKRLLKDNGIIYMVYPANRFLSFFAACQDYGFKMMKLCFVYDTKKEEALRFLVKLKKGKMTKAKIVQPIFIKDGKIMVDEL